MSIETLLLLGKIAFIAVLYGFIYVVFRSLIAVTQGARPSARRRSVSRRSRSRQLMGQQIVLRAVPAKAEGAATTASGAEGQPQDVEREDEPEASMPSALMGPAASAEGRAEDGAETAVKGAAATEEGAGPPSDMPPPVQPRRREQAQVTEAEPPGAQTSDTSHDQQSAFLLVLHSPDEDVQSGMRFALGEVTVIGRTESNDIVLRDRFVSDHHATISLQGERPVLRDMGSEVGTFCNGARVRAERAIEDGDRIAVGNTAFVFHQVSADGSES